jgi:hypothetical protein
LPARTRYCSPPAKGLSEGAVQPRFLGESVLVLKCTRIVENTAYISDQLKHMIAPAFIVETI